MRFLRRWIRRFQWGWEQAKHFEHPFGIALWCHFGSNDVSIAAELCARGHPKRAAELRVLIHALRDYCGADPEDWNTWIEGIRMISENVEAD